LAAYHVVDEVEGNPAKAFAVNAIGPRNVALACKEAGAIMVHLSTDYVFTDSSNHRPHVEDEPVNPPNVYGVSKAAGEMMIGPSWPSHFIVRGSGLYGVAGSSGKGGNFVETMLKLAEQGKPIKVVADQVLTPTSTWFLADQIALLVTTEAYGTYHATCQGECSWYQFAAEIFRQSGLDPELGPTTSAEPITHTGAKQLVPVANKPILFYAIESVVKAGISEIGMVVGDTEAEIREAVGDGERWGAHITYIRQTAPLGLAHAVKESESFLAG